MDLKNLQKALWVAIIIILNACGGGGGTGEGSAEEEASSPASTLDDVTALSFYGGQATLDLSKTSPDSSYAVVLYSADSEGANTTGYRMEGDETVSSSVNSLMASETADVTEDIHQQLREMEENLSGDPYQQENSDLRAALASLQVGSSRAFKVLASFSGSGSYNTVTANLRYIDDNFLVYVDARNANALTDAEIENVAAPFGELVEAERSIFGQESDVDNDGRFTILLSQAVNQLGGTGGGILTGFFYAADLYPTSTYAVSNEMEIVYSMVPDPTGAFGTAISKSFALGNILPQVFPHEFQHMINYNRHVFESGGSAEKSYLNEGLAHLAEDIYSVDDSDYMATTGIENPSRSALFLANSSSICFTCGSSLTQRGGSYLFVRYLYEQAQSGNLAGASSGAQLISRLLNTSKTGVVNLVYAALNSGSVSDFSALMAQFGLAMYLSDTGLTADTRYNFHGINLRAPQNDNRGTVLSGPAAHALTFPVSGTLASSGLSYSEFSGQDILNAGGTLTVTMGSGFNGGGYLVELN